MFLCLSLCVRLDQAPLLLLHLNIFAQLFNIYRGLCIYFWVFLFTFARFYVPQLERQIYVNLQFFLNFFTSGISKETPTLFKKIRNYIIFLYALRELVCSFHCSRESLFSLVRNLENTKFNFYFCTYGYVDTVHTNKTEQKSQKCMHKQ